jgi:hypothetical protein
MMTQIAWAGPKFTIDCMLANVSTQLEADGCVLACEEEGHTLTTLAHTSESVNRSLKDRSVQGGTLERDREEERTYSVVGRSGAWSSPAED